MRYYSQMEQVNYIIESLDAVCYEEALHTRLTELQSVMSKHMSLTMDMTQSLEDKMVAKDPDLKMVMTEDLLEFEEFIKEQTEVTINIEYIFRFFGNVRMGFSFAYVSV